MESPLVRSPGAVPAAGPDAGVAAHYGDPIREQRTLALSSGLVDRSHRGVIRVTGAELGLLTVPSKAAQAVTDSLVATGVRGLLNFAPGVVRFRRASAWSRWT